MNTTNATQTINVAAKSLNIFAEALFDGVKGEMDAWLEVNSDAEFRYHVIALAQHQEHAKRAPVGASHDTTFLQSFEAALLSDAATEKWLEDHEDEDDVRKAIWAYVRSVNSTRLQPRMSPQLDSIPATINDFIELANEIEQLFQGTETWNVMNGDDTGCCMSFDHNCEADPETASQKWMAKQDPEWIAKHGYHVVKETAFSPKESKALEAAQALRSIATRMNEVLKGVRVLKSEALSTRGMIDGRRQPDAYGLANLVQAYCSRMQDLIRGDIAADLAPFPATGKSGEGPKPAGFIKPDNDHSVYFYEQDFYVLSNFSSFALQWKGQRFDTSEAVYHWEKFTHLPHIQKAILSAPSAHTAFKIAEAHAHVLRPNWGELKVDIMGQILRQKVYQHRYVLQKLLATGTRTLVEDSWRDGFWGWGADARGQNMLGRLWMEVRTELQRAGVTVDSLDAKVFAALWPDGQD